MSNWKNIFDGGELVSYDNNNFYVVKWSVHNNCVVLRNGMSIVDDPRKIFEQYNIFDGKMIGVDLWSFNEEYERSNKHIEQIIVEQYGLSYIKKLILRKNLSIKDFEIYLKELGCEMKSKEEVYEGCYIMRVKDNLGEIYKLDVRFAEFDDYGMEDYKSYWSIIEILEKE